MNSLPPILEPEDVPDVCTNTSSSHKSVLLVGTFFRTLYNYGHYMLKIITFHFLYSYYMPIYCHFPKISSLPCPPTLVHPGVRLTSGAELEAPVVVNVAGPHSSQITAMALDSVSNDMTISTRAMRQAMTATVGHNGILIYGGFHKWDYTSWMVYNLENPTEIFWFVLIYFGICWSLMILGVHMFLSLDVLLFMCFPHVLSCVPHLFLFCHLFDGCLNLCP